MGAPIIGPIDMLTLTVDSRSSGCCDDFYVLDRNTFFYTQHCILKYRSSSDALILHTVGGTAGPERRSSPRPGQKKIGSTCRNAKTLSTKPLLLAVSLAHWSS